MANNEILLKLIELVKENPCLYDPKDSSFKDRAYKKEIWKDIGEDLKISSIDAKTYWERLRRKYITRRSKDLPSVTILDQKMSFLEGCCGLEQTPNRSAMKPLLSPASSSSSTDTVPLATSTSSNVAKPATTPNEQPSTSTPADRISSSTPQDKAKPHWLGLLFDELSQKVRRLPISKQMDIAKQVSQICEGAVEEPIEARAPCKADCSYIA